MERIPYTSRHQPRHIIISEHDDMTHYEQNAVTECHERWRWTKPAVSRRPRPKPSWMSSWTSRSQEEITRRVGPAGFPLGQVFVGD